MDKIATEVYGHLPKNRNVEKRLLDNMENKLKDMMYLTEKTTEDNSPSPKLLMRMIYDALKSFQDMLRMFEDIKSYPEINDSEVFAIGEFICEIARTSGGWFCGYLTLPPRYSYTKHSTPVRIHTDERINTHGDLIIISKNVVSFECNYPENSSSLYTGWKDRNYVRRELESIVKQYQILELND